MTTILRRRSHGRHIAPHDYEPIVEPDGKLRQPKCALCGLAKDDGLHT